MDNENYFDNWEFGDEITKAAYEPFRRMLQECFDDFRDGAWVYTLKGRFHWTLNNSEGIFSGEEPVDIVFDPSSMKEGLLRQFCPLDKEEILDIIHQYRKVLDTLESEISDTV